MKKADWPMWTVLLDARPANSGQCVREGTPLLTAAGADFRTNSQGMPPIRCAHMEGAVLRRGWKQKKLKRALLKKASWT